MNTFYDEHSARMKFPIVEAACTREISDKIFCGAEAVSSCVFVLHVRAMDRR